MSVGSWLLGRFTRTINAPPPELCFSDDIFSIQISHFSGVSQSEPYISKVGSEIPVLRFQGLRLCFFNQSVILVLSAAINATSTAASNVYATSSRFTGLPPAATVYASPFPASARPAASATILPRNCGLYTRAEHVLPSRALWFRPSNAAHAVPPTPICSVWVPSPNLQWASNLSSTECIWSCSCG